MAFIAHEKRISAFTSVSAEYYCWQICVSSLLDTFINTVESTSHRNSVFIIRV